MLTPLDINKKEFSRSFRGYSCEEVDEFLEQVLRDYGQVFRENQELREKNLYLTEELERYARLEKTIKDALVMAQQTSDEMRENAQREASLIIKEAENKAREIIHQAQVEVEKAERYQSDLQAKTAAFKMRFRSFLKAQLELLVDDEAAATVDEKMTTGEVQIKQEGDLDPVTQI